MENLKENYFTKLLMVVAVIFTMLFSTIAPIISYAAETFDDEGNIIESDVVKFNLNWSNGTNEITMNYGETTANFSIQFDTISYFTDFRIVVEKNDMVGVTMDNQGQYYGAVTSTNQTQYLNKIPGGTRLTGNIKFTFAKKSDYSDYSKNIKVKLIGIYEKDGEEYFVELTKELKANITTKADVNAHTASLDGLTSKNVNANIHYISNTNVYMNVDKITMTYPILLNSSRAEHTKIELDIDRTIGVADNLEVIYPDSVTINSGLTNKGFVLTKQENEDGTIKYFLEKGEVHEEFDSTKIYSLSSTVGYVTVEYNLECPEREDVGSTYTRFSIKVESDGWTQTINGEGTTNTASQIAAQDSYNYSVGTYRYVPGTYKWGNTNKSTYSTIYGENINKFIEDDKMSFRFSTSTSYVWEGNPDTPHGNTTITEYAPSIKWYNYSTKRYDTRTLTASEVRVKKITVRSMPNDDEVYMKFYRPNEIEPFFTADKDHLEYEFEDGDNIANFTVVANEMVKYQNQGYYIDYEMTASKIMENGVTQENISNIREITQSQQSTGAYMNGGTLSATYTVRGYRKEQLSNMRIAVKNLYVRNQSIPNSSYYYNYNTDLSTTATQVGESIDTNIYLSLSTLGLSTGTSGDIVNYGVSATNPKIYFVLPNEFDFIINDITVNNMPNLKITGYKIKIINNRKILEITTNGNFEMNDEHLSYDTLYGFTINCSRTLKQGVTSSAGTLYAYMTSDEGKYFISGNDPFDVDGDGDTNDVMAHDSLSFSITKNSQIQLLTGAQCISGDLKTNEDVILPAGSTVKYTTILDNNYTGIKGINIVTRLPFEGNKSIKSADKIDLESDTTFTNLRNIKIYTIDYNGRKSEIDSKNYTLGYSEEEEADLDTEYDTDASKISSAKTLQVKFASNYVLYSGSKILIEYDMDIPEDAEKGDSASQIVAARYTTSSGGKLDDQEASKIKVIVGDPTGKIKVIKTFAGSKPDMDVSGIKIKIQNLYNEEQVYEVLTDEDGHAVFENIPHGYWKITEETEFADFECKESKYAIITNGEKYIESIGKAINLVNTPKYGNIVVYKTWKNSSEIINGYIKFTAEGKTVGGDNYSNYSYTSTYTDDDGNKVQKTTIKVPYGEYTLKEQEATINSNNPGEQWGWYAKNVKVSVHEPEVEVHVENEIAYGNLKIVKTVPNGEDPQGLKFHLFGRGDASYTNDKGEKVYLDVDETVTIGADGTAVIPHIPLGVYTLEEIEIPNISILGGETEKYVPIRKTVRVTKRDYVDEYNIDNKWKKGNIDVTVTATSGADLSLFKVQVQGTSYYGTKISQVYDVPENGKLSIKDLPLGKYKVTEYDTRTENGKIYTNNPDGFEVTYDPDIARTTGIEVEYKKTTKVNIHNEYNGVGYLQINKTIEDEDDPSAAEGIKFILRGKNLIGEEHEETITIGHDGIGKSGAIPVGTYLLTEVEDSVPLKYALVEDKEVTIRKAYTESKPLELNIENKIATNDIKMDTELKNGGYPPLPVTYKITEVDDELKPIGEPTYTIGDKKSHAELLQVKTGRYLIEQESVPSGYIKDDPQVVTIDRKTPGYALFVIEKPEGPEFERTRLTITKQVVNKDGEIASDEEFTKAKLDSRDKYSFEFKITNTETKQVYYSFAEENNTDTIVGLPYGTYEIEEIYKPKFEFVEMTSEKLTYNEETKKYTFTFTENGSTLQNSIYINVKNRIDTEFGFGGQDFKDNLSKVLVEQEEREFITQAKIYIRDDINNRVSDATFKLLDSNGNALKFIGADGIYVYNANGEEILTPTNGAIYVKALPVGTYTLVNESVGDAYLAPANKEIIVYDSVVGVNRVEVLRNIPRGSLRLSTVYIDDNGVENYTPRSKYKIMDSRTYEVLTFVKKADGTYYRSNLPTATDTIAIKQGYINIEGIEAGIEYQVGLVDVTEKYGEKTPEVQKVTIEEGAKQEVKVEVADRRIKFVKVETPGSGVLTVALDESGKIWAYDGGSGPYTYSRNNYSIMCVNDLSDHEVIKNVRFVDIATADNMISAIDTDGKLWTWSWGNSLGSSSTPTCVSDIENCPLNNVRIKQVSYQAYGGNAMYILDENGKIWFRGSPQNYITNKNNPEPWVYVKSDDVYVANLSEKCNLADVTISYMAPLGSYNQMVAIDNNGKVWTWGRNNNGLCGLPYQPGVSYDYEEYGEYYTKPICISDIEGSNIKSVKMKKVSCDDYANYLIDTNNNLWAFGTTYYNSMCIAGGTQYFWNPICLSDPASGSSLSKLKFKDIACQYETVAAVDIDGMLWTWGYERDDGLLGLGHSYYSEYNTSTALAPICVSELDNNELRNYELEQVSAAGYNSAGAVDSDGNLWMWGNEFVPVGFSSYDVKAPAIIHVSNFAHWDIPTFTKISAAYYGCAGIDENGKVWTWGQNNNYNLGIGESNSSYTTQIPKRIGGKNDAISGETIVDISTGYYHTFAIDKEGKLWAWGRNYNRTFGVYTGISSINTPICITNMEGKLQGKKIKKACAGNERSVVIDEDGKVYTMGHNNYNSLGIGSISYDYRSVYCLNELYPELRNKKFVDGRYSFYECCSHLILLDEDGKVWMCGRNQNGELGTGSFANEYINYPVCISNIEGSPLNGKKITQVEVGSYHTSAAIDEDGNLYMWGYNGNGELGDGTNNNSATPLCLTQDKNNRLYGKKITKVSLGYNASLIVDDEGKVYTTGADYSFQLGQGHNDTGKSTNIFVCINNKINFVPEDIDLGFYFGIGLDKEHNVWTWGDSGNYRNGAGYQFSKPVKWFGPTEVYDSAVDTLDGENAIEIIRHTDRISGIAQSNDTMEAQMPDNVKESYKFNTNTFDSNGKDVRGDTYIALDKDGKVWTWGTNNSYGILGDGTTTPRYTRTAINDKMDNVSIDSIIEANSNRVILRDTNGTIWGWGYNYNALLGTVPASTIYKEPRNISEGTDLEGKNIVSVKVKGTYCCYAIDSDGKVYSWGNNAGSSYLGNGQSSGVYPPTKIGDDTDMANAKIEKIETTSYGIYAYAENGKVYTWGYNGHNQCGNGTTNQVTYPNTFGKGTSLSSLSIDKIYEINATNTMLLTTDGKLYVWGQNYNGTLGVGNTNAHITDPINLTAEKNFTVREVIKAGSENIIVDTNGKVWTWGITNSYGILGNESSAASPSATCISRNKFRVKEVVGVYDNRIIIKDTNDKLWTWGKNLYGQCGNGTSTNVYAPYCMTPDFTVDKVYASSSNTRVIDSDGKLWVCGYNSSGACGVGSNVTVITSLTEVEGDYKVDTVYKNDASGFLFKDIDGKTWACGTYARYDAEIPANKTVCISDNSEIDGKTLKDIKILSSTVFAFDTEGKLYSWGLNTSGTAGIGSDDSYTKPTCINKGELANVKFISVGEDYSNGETIIKALDSNGKIWLWGTNNNLGIMNRPVGIVRSPVCISDVYEEIGYDPMKNDIINVIPNTKVFIDDEGKVWTWGSTSYLCGAGTDSAVTKPTCISTEYNALNLKNGTIHHYASMVYAINNDGEAWVWGQSVNYPIRLKNTTALKNLKIMEIGFDTSTGKLIVLTDSGELYRISLSKGFQIEEVEYSGEVLETIGNITGRLFMPVTDAEYNQ